jgi:outer membrane murein-binding lipoprotein Lpp
MHPHTLMKDVHMNVISNEEKLAEKLRVARADLNILRADLRRAKDELARANEKLAKLEDKA